MAPDRLRTRILIWVEEEVRVGALPPKSGAVLEAVLFRGELPRGDVAAILGTRGRQARRVTAALLEGEILVSESSRAPLRLAFPARHARVGCPDCFLKTLSDLNYGNFREVYEDARDVVFEASVG